MFTKFSISRLIIDLVDIPVLVTSNVEKVLSTKRSYNVRIACVLFS